MYEGIPETTIFYDPATGSYGFSTGSEAGIPLTRGKISKPEYDRLLLHSETARTASEERLVLNRHTKKHGC